MSIGTFSRILASLGCMLVLYVVAAAQALTTGEVARDAERYLNSDVTVKGVVASKHVIEDVVQLDNGLHTQVEIREGTGGSPLKVLTTMTFEQVPAKGTVAEFKGKLKREAGGQLVLESVGGINWMFYGLVGLGIVALVLVAAIVRSGTTVKPPVRRCENCQAALEPGAEFCTICGYSKPVPPSGITTVDSHNTVGTLVFRGGEQHDPTPIVQNLKVGRDPAKIEPNGIHLDQSSVSGLHAQYRILDGGGVAVVDLDSTNGTFVNGERISGERRIKDGDQIRIGGTTMVFQAIEPAAKQAATSA